MIKIRYIAKPTEEVVEGFLVFTWEGIVVVEIVGKGKGVVTTKRLKRGLCIPYGGVVIGEREFRNGTKSSCRAPYPADYFCQYEMTKHNVVINHADAHPQRHEIAGCKNAWIGSFCNDASSGSSGCNAIIEWRPRGPEYPKTSVKLYVVLTRDVEEDEEICVDYGYSKTLKKHCGIPHEVVTETSKQQSEGPSMDFIELRRTMCKHMNESRKRKRDSAKERRQPAANA